MRLVGSILAGVIALVCAAPVHGLTPSVIDPTIQADAEKPVLISSLYTKRGETFLELHNNTERPIALSGWSVRFISATSEADVALPNGWLLADEYVSFSEASIVPGTIGFPSLSLPIVESISDVEVYDAAHTVSSVSVLPVDITSKWYQRKSSGLSGVFVNDFSAATASTKLRHTPLYQLPESPPVLRIVEIYPHASDCTPTDASVLCGDYVKLFNPSESIAYVEHYRLRSNSSTSESSNAFHLDRFDDVEPGGYLTVSLRDDGGALSLTDSGGWVWLEDSEGVVKYEETIVQYPSASSVTKIGHAWALSDDGQWSWTVTPMPGDKNAFPEVLSVSLGADVLDEASSCPAGKYRNPDTNRCRNIEDAIATLVACSEGQSRNPETNRCRSTATLASAQLTPCATGQERNPETNRCRAVNTTGASLTPCLAGQERNPETNRCKKSVLGSALSPADINPIKQQTGTSPLALSLIGAIGAGAIGYGIYEWRSELSGALRRVASRVGKK